MEKAAKGDRRRAKTDCPKPGGARSGFARCFAAATAFVVAACVGFPGVASAIVHEKIELKCSKDLSKGAQRLSSRIAREYGRCRTGKVAGTVLGSCPSTKGQLKIDKTIASLTAKAASSCVSHCSLSTDISCVGDEFCPPAGSAAETCSAGAANLPFDMRTLGFPGPYCAWILGHEMSSPADLAECVTELVEAPSFVFVDAMLGAVPNSANLSKAGNLCLNSAVGGTSKYVKTVFKTAAKCRDAVDRGKSLLNVVTCVDDNPKLLKKVNKARVKLRDLMVAKCTPAAVAELDLCATGVGSTTSVAAASDCLAALGDEVANSPSVPAERVFSPISLMEGVYPPPARCGDGIVNQLPNPFLLVGEECDGSDDTACPGKCLPPGDLFECTCGDRPRLRFFASSEGSETDAGWTGLSHNQLAADRSGYIVEVSNCDCSAFSGATCIGTSSDPVCDLLGSTLPVCSHSPTSPSRCDALGDGDGSDEDEDCYICDARSANAGAVCRDENDCQSRCYDASGVPQGFCSRQSECGVSETCSGRCDKTQTCLRTPNGGPLPVNSAGAAVCAVNRFRTDVTGTMNLATGQHEISFQLFSQIHTGESVSRPCPVCGGFCVGGGNANQICAGRCSIAGTECRFHDDCPGTEQCQTASPDCPGGFCELSLVCGTNPAANPDIEGRTCRVTAKHAFFGTISNDCLPSSASNTTGRGLEIDYLPWTSGTIVKQSTVPCTAPGFELYECPCPDDGGQPSKPNNCAPACNAAGPDFGVGCADGNSSGKGTVCTAGANAGLACDDNSDCPGSSCATNPRHCSGDPAYARFSCATNADCGLGNCVDACPGGRCVPLCVASAADPVEGECAAGPSTYHCDGQKYLFKSCASSAAEAGCEALCSTSDTPCADQSDCPAGETCSGSCEQARDCAAGQDGVVGTLDDFKGAGRCVEDIRPCFLEPITATGGTTLNGGGDPTNMSTVGLFCQKKSAVNTGANSGAGFGGPTRVRVRGVNIPNFTSLP